MTIACYARKSNDKENDSIENQISIIRDYISHQKDFRDAEIIQFSDNGASGIDLNRDAFQELLSKVRLREIDVVVVKDLSRLGRNYLDVCKLTDSIFPFMKVRFIAISENYDSKYRKINSMDLPMTFRSVLNEYYAMESSRKIKESCVSRIRKGEFIGSRIPPPTIRTSKWVANTIRKILKNEKYTGKRVTLKYRKDLKTREKILTDKSEWYVDEQAFPPIISHEIFEQVQAILPKSKISNPSGSHIMAKKLYCAGCGKVLKRNKHFQCKKSSSTGENPCFQGSLKRDFLYQAVLEKVKEFIATDIPDSRLNFSFSDIAGIESEITSLKEKKAEIFEHLFNGDITQTEFEKQNTDVSSRITAKQNELQLCRRTVALNTKYSSECPVDTLKRLYAVDELTREHMQFVERINVFDSEHFEIIMQPDSPLAVLCKNMDIYEEVGF